MSREPIKTASTGVPNLDAILGGGIPLYSVNIIAGASGTGKTILMQQMMYQQQFDYFDLERLNENLFYGDSQLCQVTQ